MRKPYKYVPRKPFVSRPLTDVEDLHRWFVCDSETGALYVKERPRSDFATKAAYTMHKKRVGKPAGSIGNFGYIMVGYRGQSYGAHRIVYTMVHGIIPDGLHIDHKNGVKHDNRPDNIRVVTRWENQRNTHLPITSRSGYPGVYPANRREEKWYAQCCCLGINYKIGPFDTALAAHLEMSRLKENMGLGYGPAHGLPPE